MSGQVALDENVASYGKAPGKVNKALKVILYILASIEILFGLLMIVGGFVDRLVSSDVASEKPFFVVVFLCVPIGVAAGICSAIATRHAHYRTVATWTVVHWAWFALLFFALLVIAMLQQSPVSISILSSMLFFKLIQCILFSYLNTIPKFYKSVC